MENFDPFLDYDAVSDEMAEDLYEGLSAYESAKAHLLASPVGSKERVKWARKVLEAQKETADTAGAIYETIYTIPMIVHEAGERKIETDDDGNEFTVQRCKRCASVLQSWAGTGEMTMFGQQIDVEDLPWWEDGDVVAKSGDSDYRLDLYLIEDRPLEKYEYKCVALNELVGGD